ncbi:ribosome biogenesis protein SLX9-domain-containing protein [Lasiosphaeria hispida]|uniref:Ribosome biogenesis protein SLX9 n=1 Tax=Lasiosphaeria hispida TaxID=260671 RepID=A0AAJ0HSZ7_9PEZI|nr:ribosome biogenesis protein SLX9-domain-containing protein [Lasiosphaeria hispida]
MAPVAPTPIGKKRLTAREKTRLRLADPLLPRKLHRAEAVVPDGFLNTKRDKRTIKHSSFVSRIAKSHPSSSSALKRRRPSKKLVATLESLGDVLDDISTEMKEHGVMDAEQALQGKVRHKSLRSRPGALKRKERVVKGEMERFGRSLAQLTAVTEAAPAAGSTAAPGVTAPAKCAESTDSARQAGGQAAQTSATSSRWAALRGFISATMEQNPAFLAKTTE